MNNEPFSHHIFAINLMLIIVNLLIMIVTSIANCKSIGDVTPLIYFKPGGYQIRNKNTSIKIKQKFDRVSPVNRSYWTSGLYEELSK